MWQRAGSSTLLKAGFAAAAWIVGAGGTPANSSSLFLSAPAFEASARGSNALLSLPGTPTSGLLDPAGGSVIGEDALPTALPAALISPGGESEAAGSALCDPARLPEPEGAAAALREIRAAAAGSLSLDDTEAPCRDRRLPLPRPVPAPPSPLLPAAPALPDPRALLALVALPTWTAARPLRRRGRRLTGAVAERLSTVLGLLLIVLWVALPRGK
jgi:hypothetical protein